MFHKLKRTAVLASASLIAFTVAASAQDMPEVSLIDVETSLSAATDSNAMAYYPDLANDIRAEVAKLVPTSSDAADPEIRIDIRKVALNGAAILPNSKEFNELEGVVAITGTDGASGGLSFPVAIAAVSGDQVVPEGYIAVPPSTGDFYVAMVTAFARTVAAGLAEVNTSGDIISR